MSWQDTENYVRKIASYIWERPAVAETIAGVKCDCVVKIEADRWILIEITEQCSLEKVRSDILKLRTVKSALLQEEIYAKCYFVMREKPTDSMRSSGSAQKIHVMSMDEFKNMYFDYPGYFHLRSEKQFGSLVNFETGKPEQNEYINVSYISRTGREFGISEIIANLKAGKKIILKGDFGSGKSRCVKQVFDTVNREKNCNFYTIAINVREHWGARRSPEILHRHFEELGLDYHNFMKSFTNPSVLYLLDGFDEIGTQLWTTDVKKMRHAKMMSVAALRDLLSKAEGGVLISGREYYFNSDKDMLDSLGLNGRETIILECRSEFSDGEIVEFLKKNCSNLPHDITELPEWLPRRPLVMQLVLKYARDVFSLKNALADICDFWYELLNRICEREANINSILSPDTIKQILILLARKTRKKNLDIGPITLQDLSDAFVDAVGVQPNDESAIMLQRLPAIGRVDADSSDRQFLDVFILNGLRVEDIIQIQRNSDQRILDEAWQNPLDANGCAILSEYIRKEEKRNGVFLALASQAAKHKNGVLAADIVSTLLLAEDSSAIDFKNICISNAFFKNLCMEGRQISNLYIEDSIIDYLDITNASFCDNSAIAECEIDKIVGISSEKGLPAQIRDCRIDNFESFSTVSRIKRAKLSAPQKILVTIIKKIFFQPGNGRKEEALLRGLGAINDKRYAEKILNKLLDENIIRKHKGDEGYIYSPQRKYAARMDGIITQLTMSEDEIWIYVSNLAKEK